MWTRLRINTRSNIMKLQHTLFIVAGSIIAAGLVLQSQAQQQAPDALEWTPAQPAVSFVGSYSKIKERTLDRIADRESWNALWAKHVGEDAERDTYDELVYPRIDFEHYMVIALFNGEGWNARGMYLIETAEVNGEFHVRFDISTYQTMSMEVHEPIIIEGEMTPEKMAEAARQSMEEEQAKREAAKETDPNYSNAYGMFVLPRTDKPVVLFENVQGLIGEPPIWKERQRIPAVKQS